MTDASACGGRVAVGRSTVAFAKRVQAVGGGTVCCREHGSEAGVKGEGVGGRGQCGGGAPRYIVRPPKKSDLAWGGESGGCIGGL